MALCICASSVTQEKAPIQKALPRCGYPEWSIRKVKSELEAKTYKNKSSAVAEMGDRGHNKHGPKKWGLCPLLEEGSWVPI